MKKEITAEILSLGLCVVMSVSMAACNKTEGTRRTTAETEFETIAIIDETALTKPEGSSEETTEVTSEQTTEETSAETTSEQTSQSSERVTVNPYEKFIEGYKEAIINPTDTWYYGPGADTSDYMNLGQGLIVVEIQGGFSYTLFDIDKDGVDELIIGGIYTDGENAKHVFVTGVVTLDGDGYKIVAAGWSRSSLEYTGEGYFVNSGSGGAALHYDIVYTYDGKNKELATVGALVTEYVGNAEITKAQYSYFTDEHDAYSAYPAYGDDRALCFDEEAKNKIQKDQELAYSKNNELLNAQWIDVDCH